MNFLDSFSDQEIEVMPEKFHKEKTKKHTQKPMIPLVEVFPLFIFIFFALFFLPFFF